MGNQKEKIFSEESQRWRINGFTARKIAFKKVILLNAKACKGITEGEIAIHLLGLGKYEWERLLSNYLMEAIENSESDEVDISKMFNCELCGYDSVGEYVKSHSETVKFLIDRLFKVISDTEDKMEVNCLLSK